jgi:hypothetical protein
MKPMRLQQHKTQQHQLVLEATLKVLQQQITILLQQPRLQLILLKKV